MKFDWHPFYTVCSWQLQENRSKMAAKKNFRIKQSNAINKVNYLGRLKAPGKKSYMARLLEKSDNTFF